MQEEPRAEKTEAPASEAAYVSPLVSRYASSEMSAIFSPERRIGTWRRLWLALAEVEQELGLAITDEQIAEMREHLDDVDFEAAREYEAQLRHDVMAHVHAFGDQCPMAKPIIHLGATSCFVTDNADLILMREGLQLLRVRMANLIDVLTHFMSRYRDVVTIGFTHFQPAQPTTVGKRSSLWLYDFVLDYWEISRLIDALPMRSAKGTTGTQASFLELFEGSSAKVRDLEHRVAERMGFATTVPVSGQTYTRKLDSMLLNALGGIGQSAAKMANDIRLLQHLQEVEEPHGEHQVGSSAMPHKRNPMRCERICSLSRHLIANTLNPAMTAATQWLERTLDDSAGRRIAIPEAFLAADAIVLLVTNVAGGLIVNRRAIAQRLRDEMPFLTCERLLMAAVRAGGDRQHLHERLRLHAWQARKGMVELGFDNDLIDRIKQDPAFAAIHRQVDELLLPKGMAGRCARQVDEFLRTTVRPILAREADTIGIPPSPSV